MLSLEVGRQFDGMTFDAAGIVVGRMQHDGLVPHSRWANLIQRYRYADD